jgi:hypothetical protein
MRRRLITYIRILAKQLQRPPPSNTGFTSNFDFGYGYLQGDFDMNGKAKFDNPDDDKNMLYGQLLFYPLNASVVVQL